MPYHGTADAANTPLAFHTGTVQTPLAPIPSIIPSHFMTLRPLQFGVPITPHNYMASSNSLSLSADNLIQSITYPQMIDTTPSIGQHKLGYFIVSIMHLIGL